MAAPFTGRWICDPRFASLKPLKMAHREHEKPDFGGTHPDDLRNVHTLFRRSFRLSKAPGKYILRFSADDYAKVYINGAFVGQGPTPGYEFAYHYVEIDVTDALRDGENVILAHAYYQGLVNRVWESGDLREGFICDLIAPDGSAVLSTDPAWEYAAVRRFTGMRTTGYETQYLEDVDDRLTDDPFAPAAVRDPAVDDIVFDAAPTPMIQLSERNPVSVEPLPQGGVFADFGQEFVGTLRITADGETGARIRILCGEETDDSPERVRWAMRCNCKYEDLWTLAGGRAVLDQYDYKGFRYVSLIPEGNAKIVEVAAVDRHAPFDDSACTLTADDKVLEAVFTICKNGVKYGTQENYVDCPTREKGQYAGDMTVTSGSQLWLTGNIAMLEKAIREQARSAVIDEGLMAVTPGSLMQEIADYSLQFPLLLLRHYSFTKDSSFLAEMLPVAEKMRYSFARFARADGLLDGVTSKWNLVDWPDNLRDGYDFKLTKPIGPGVHNVINAFYVGCVKNIEEIRAILGLPVPGDALRLAEAFNRVFLDPDTGLYVDAEGSRHSSLHANILAPFYGFCPKANEKRVGDFLVERGFVCGVYMTYFMMKGLCRMGRYEDVYRMITSTGENSWYNMVREGGTTCFEAWGKDKKWNTSLCHPWASSPVIVLIEDLLNVAYDGTAGKPRLPACAGHLTMKIPTAVGTVTVSV